MSGDAPRNLGNLPALLNFCVRNTATEDAPSAPTGEMDPERRKWLDDALSEMTISPVEEMQKNLKMIRDTLDQVNESALPPSEEACSTLQSALENIVEYVCSIDCANDFHKIGGFEVLDPLLHFPNAVVCSKTSALIAELVQNNPYCQREAAGHLKTLLKLIDTAEDENVRIKALYAVSCMVRHNLPGYLEFEKQNGLAVLMRTLQSNVLRLKAKACFLLSSLCSQQTESRETLLQMGFVEQLAALLRHEQGPHREHLLGTLATLVTECASARDECRRPELQLEATLRECVGSASGREECREERDHCALILATCFNDRSHEAPEMDR
ncbi:hsp70-binding protein 1 [Ixodes scapularis]